MGSPRDPTETSFTEKYSRGGNELVNSDSKRISMKLGLSKGNAYWFTCFSKFSESDFIE